MGNELEPGGEKLLNGSHFGRQVPAHFAGPAFWGRYLRSTWILREEWHQMEDRAHMPDTPAKVDRYVERAVFQFHPVRGQLRSAAVSEAAVPLPSPPLGQHFVRALPARWRSVVAALARAIQGGTRASRYPFVSTVVLIRNESRMSVTPDGPL